MVSKECWVKSVGDCEMRVETRRDQRSQDTSSEERHSKRNETGDVAIELEPVAAVSRRRVLWFSTFFGVQRRLDDFSTFVVGFLDFQ